ncbi:hypothetical protein GEMRC1_010273 [Eukaryota sp. GEM-RC1]
MYNWCTPKRFGILFDGWKHGPSSTEFVAIFACAPNELDPILLGFLPFELEPEQNDAIIPTSTIMLGVSNYYDLIVTILTAFSRKAEDVLFIVGDHTSVNKALAVRFGVPMIGCYSHQ